MSKENQQESRTADREIVLTRLLNAPVALVWKIWTDPEHIAKWWGPDGFTNTIHKMDFRPGGTWDYIMHGPDGTDYRNVVEYETIIEHELIEYKHGSGVENDPHAFRVRITMKEQNGKTELTMYSIFQTADMRDFVVEKFGAIEGGNQTINKLEQYLSSASN